VSDVISFLDIAGISWQGTDQLSPDQQIWEFTCIPATRISATIEFTASL
jgi:hypothetical protein